MKTNDLNFNLKYLFELLLVFCNKIKIIKNGTLLKFIITSLLMGLIQVK